MSKAIGMEATHSFTLTWKLDIDTNDTTTELELPMSTRFGEAVLMVKVKARQHLELDSADRLSFLDEGGVAKLAPFWQDGSWTKASAIPERDPEDLTPWGLKCEYEPEWFTDCADQYPEFKSKEHRRFWWELKFSDVEPAACIATAPLPSKPMRVAVASISSQCPNNLGLVFPRANAELWTNAEALAGASPYFKTLLASEGFAESVVRGRKRARMASVLVKAEGGREASQQATPPAAGAEGEDDQQEAEDGAEEGEVDSDDETDAFDKRSGVRGASEGDINPDVAYREVTITESAYSTYRAVLVYLHTSHITFAPLASSLLPSSSVAAVTRAAYLKEVADDDPSLPLPVSPKAVYALAHLLELPNLMSLALAEIKAQLTVENAAVELFSETSSLYNEVRDTLLDFAVANWAEVKVSEGMVKVKRRAEAGELPAAGAIFARLIDRV